MSFYRNWPLIIRIKDYWFRRCMAFTNEGKTLDFLYHWFPQYFSVEPVRCSIPFQLLEEYMVHSRESFEYDGYYRDACEHFEIPTYYYDEDPDDNYEEQEPSIENDWHVYRFMTPEMKQYSFPESGQFCKWQGREYFVVDKNFYNEFPHIVLTSADYIAREANLPAIDSSQLPRNYFTCRNWRAIYSEVRDHCLSMCLAFSNSSEFWSQLEQFSTPFLLKEHQNTKVALSAMRRWAEDARSDPNDELDWNDALNGYNIPLFVFSALFDYIANGFPPGILEAIPSCVPAIFQWKGSQVVLFGRSSVGTSYEDFSILIAPAEAIDMDK